MAVFDHPLLAQNSFEFSAISRLTNNEITLSLTAPKTNNYRLETAETLSGWHSLATITNSTGVVTFTDSAGPYHDNRFYRAAQLQEPNVLTGDHLTTEDGDVIIHPINHATFVMKWKDKMLYVDPVGGASRFAGLPRADLILVTHDHGDHFDAPTITAVKTTNTAIVVTKTVFNGLSAALRTQSVTMTNGSTFNVLGLTVDAVPAYNLTSTWHTKGQGNGYLLTVGGKRIYIGGDTEDIPEMRSLTNIDVAFLCMNLPYTMNVDKAVSATRAFRPLVAYLYHYQGTSTADVNRYKTLVGNDLWIEVRLRKWY
jgi:L-ascorbate metabolism protein UlaG (beta-lactamase superfamily)